MEICSSSHPRDKQRKKTPLVLKTATYQSGTIHLFLGSSLLSVGPVSDFTPKGPEVMNQHQQFHSWERGRVSGPGGQEMVTLRHAPWEE